MTTIISNDGVEIPEEGMSFEVIRHFNTPEQVTETMVLKELLRGLNVIKREGNVQSQAASFCSYARQMGYTTEEEIIAAEPWVVLPRRDKKGQEYYPAWQLISTWEQAVREERSDKALTSMKGKPITDRQIAMITKGDENNPGLIPRLREQGYDDLANTLHSTIQIGDRADASQWIARAMSLLGMNDPRPARNNGVEDTHVSDDNVADEQKDTANAKPDPF